MPRHEWISKSRRRIAYRFWTVCSLYTTAIEEEADGVGSLALSLTEGIHELLQGSGSLDLKEDLIIVVGNLDV